MRVDLLCSGSKGNACIIRSKETQIMIDCGSTKKYLFKALEQANVKKENNDALLITHTHTDHVSQLKHFQNAPIYSHCSIEVPDKHIIVNPFESFMIKDLKITVIGLSHDSPNTCGYIIEDGEEKLVYVTDTGFVPNVFKPLMENADYYIFESNHDVKTLMQTNRPYYVKHRIIGDTGHLCNEDSSNNLASLINTNTKEIILAHISEDGNRKEIVMDTIENTFKRKQLPMSKVQIRAAQQFEINTILGK
ncbi:MAG: MBL fold metallo-hydrolase [Bacillota bacterium]|nr:MBL fold metallo-hydrolase [Bacillota bacterium]